MTGRVYAEFLSAKQEKIPKSWYDFIVMKINEAQGETGMEQRAITLKDYLKILAVVVIWGFNFVAIKIGLSGFPPLFMVVVRFFLVFFPAALFVKRPQIPARYLMLYGFFLGIGQFGFLFFAISIGLPAGVASVLLQSQVVFTLILSAVLLKEKITGIQVLGILISVFGVLYLGGVFQTGSELPLAPFFLAILAAVCFGASNVAYRGIHDYNQSHGLVTDVTAILVWTGLYIPLPMLLISLVLETPEVIWTALTRLEAPAVISIGYSVVLSTFVAYGLWNRLISRFSASRIAPFSLLVPLAGVLGAVLFLGETVSLRQTTGMAITIAGLVVANLGNRLFKFIRLGMVRKVPSDNQLTK